MTLRDPELFLTKVARRITGYGECWEWLGQRMPNGYGYCHRRGMGETLAHRVSYRLFVGGISGGFTIDHLCRNRGCVNPEHLEAVPFVENVRRGLAPNIVRARRGTCDRGHPFVPLGHAERVPARCGTPSGYYAHLRRGEEACRPCKDANAANRRRQRAGVRS